MKAYLASLLVVALLCVGVQRGAFAAAGASAATGLIDCDIGKVALIDDTTSEHGRYALGWTIRVRNKRAKPVDWSLWTPNDDTGVIRDKYIYNLKNDTKFPYNYGDYVVDLGKKTTLELPGADFFVGWARHRLSAYWGSDLQMPLYGLAQNQSRFSNDNLFLIKSDKTGMSAIDLVKRLNSAVRKILDTRMPLLAGEYAISYPCSDWDDVASSPAFHQATLDIPFTAELEKSAFDKLTGTVIVHLPEGTLMKVSSNNSRDDPFHDDPALSAADHDLNNVYSTLQKRLDPATSAALKAEQVKWIAKRNADAGVKDYPILGRIWTRLHTSTIGTNRFSNQHCCGLRN